MNRIVSASAAVVPKILRPIGFVHRRLSRTKKTMWASEAIDAATRTIMAARHVPHVEPARPDGSAGASSTVLGALPLLLGVAQLLALGTPAVPLGPRRRPLHVPGVSRGARRLFVVGARRAAAALAFVRLVTGGDRSLAGLARDAQPAASGEVRRRADGRDAHGAPPQQRARHD